MAAVFLPPWRLKRRALASGDGPGRDAQVVDQRLHHVLARRRIRRSQHSRGVKRGDDLPVLGLPHDTSVPRAAMQRPSDSAASNRLPTATTVSRAARWPPAQATPILVSF